MRRPPLRPVVWQPPAIPDRARARSGPRALPPVRRLEGWTCLGSLAERAVAVLDLPP